MGVHAFITGLAGLELGADERAFVREAEPWGAILFARNVSTPDQVRALVGEFREAVGRANAPVLIDQEGGRVQRLRPPQWSEFPPGAAYGRLYDRDPQRGVAAAHLGARLIAADLDALGISVDCLPLADMPVPGADSIIGDRAYGGSGGKGAALAAPLAQRRADGAGRPGLPHPP